MLISEDGFAHASPGFSRAMLNQSMSDDDDSTRCTTVRPVVLCAPSVVINGRADKVSNPDYEIIWSTGERGPSITVSNSGTYSVEYRYKPGNRAENGDFEKGNTLFTSAYTFRADNGNLATNGYDSELWSEKTYAVVSNPRLVHANFPNGMGDHTSGSGRMMVINGSTDQNVNIWAQKIEVLPNTCYVFSIYASSLTPIAPANLIFSINDSQFGVIKLTSTVNKWTEFKRIWYSGNYTEARIAIVNQTTELNGNDFALDDITFVPYEKEVINVDLKPKDPIIQPNY